MKVFDYPVQVHPHHTDYAGVVWHGSYIAWMEAARIAYLQSHGVNFASWVEAGVDLPVVDLSLRYHRPLTLGMTAIVKTSLEPRRGIRLVWHFDIQDQVGDTTCVVGTVTLVPVDRHRRQVLRRLPAAIEQAINSLYS